MQDELNPDELREELTADIGNRLAIQEMAKRHECTYTDIIIALAKTKELRKYYARYEPKIACSSRSWTPEEEETAANMFSDDVPVRKIAIALNRPYQAVTGKISRMRKQGEIGRRWPRYEHIEYPWRAV